MDFLKEFKQRKSEFNSDYINICKFIDDIRVKENEQVSNIALAMRYFDIQNKLDTYTATDALIITKNDSRSILDDFLNKLVNYGSDYIGGIKKDEYIYYINVYLKKEDVKELAEFKDSIVDEEDKELGFNAFADFLKLWDSPKYLQNHSYVSLLEAACIISRDYPRSIAEKIGALDITEDWDFIAARKYIVDNIKNKRLSIDEENLGIPIYQLKVAMFEDEKIIKGFNDDILTSMYEELISPSIHLEIHDDDDIKLPHVIKIPPNLKDSVLTSYPRALEKEVEHLKAEVDELKAMNNDISIKESSYLLIATMKDMLLNPDLTGFRFQSDNEKGKQKPIQGKLTEYIEELSIKGLGARVVNNIFSDSNKKLSEYLKK